MACEAKYLAAALVRSLFCGLPRQEKRMAVFVAASDESLSGDKFYRCGFVGPENDWSDWFAPAWAERVLDGSPRLPFLHMTDIRSRDFRKKHRLSDREAERRLDEAFRVIASMGSLYLVGSTINVEYVKNAFANTKIIGRITPQKRIYPMDPDYLSFITFCYAVLFYVRDERPECEKVDFVIERNSAMTDRIRDFHESMPDSLSRLGESDLIPLLGELIPGGKDRTPLQAADVLCWYTQRAESGGEMSDADRSRFATVARRKAYRPEWTQEQINRIAGRAEPPLAAVKAR